MLLNLSSTAAYARTSTSQSNLGTATALGFKVRLNGAALLSGNASTGSNIIQLCNTSGGSIRLAVFCQVAGGNLVMAVAGPGGANPSPITAIEPSANITSGDEYVLRITAGTIGWSIELFDAAGTSLASGSASASAIANNNAANGVIRIGATAVSSIVGNFDGAAVYSQAPPANNDAPDPGDTGILWGVLDDSGNIVEGATDLDTLNAASWGGGGSWDAPANPVEVTPGVTALEIAGFAPSVSTTADAVLTPAPASMEVTGYAPVVVGTQVWGALGDSQTDEYQGDDERGPAEVLNWLELLVQVRGLDFGAWSDSSRGEPRREGYAYNWARSGVTMPDVIDDQLAGLAAQVAAGIVTHAVLFATGNEWVNFGPQYAIAIYNGNGTTSSAGTALSTIVSTVAGQHIACMDDIDEALDTAGSGGGMVVLTPPDYMAYPAFIATFTNATRRGWVAGVIQSIYEAVAAHADSLNDAAGYTRFAVRRSDYHMAAVWGSADGQYMTASGVALDYTEDWEYDPDSYDPYHYALAPTTGSAHIGTIAGGEFARTFVDAANDLTGVSIAQLEDEEILAAAGIDDTAPTLTPAPASLEVTGLAPAVTATAHVTVSPAPASAEVQGYAPAVATTANVSVSPAPASLEAAGYAPTASATAHQTVTPAAAEVHATTYAPTVLATAHVSVTPAAASVEVTTYAPSVATTGHVQVVPGTASAAVTTYAPDVAATAHLSVTPGAASLEVATYAPTVTYDGSVSITPSRAQVRVTGHAPTVTGIADVEVTPAPATLAVSTYAPEIGVTVRVAPVPAQVEVTGYTPIVTTTEHVVVTPPPGTIAVIGRAPTVVGVAPVSVMPAPGQVVLLAYAPAVSVASVAYPPGPAAPERTASVPAEVRVYLVPAPQTVTL